MTEINWGEIAVEKGLSAEEFLNEMLTSACCVAAISIDQNRDKGNALKFTYLDEVGPIELVVRRLENG